MEDYVFFWQFVNGESTVANQKRSPCEVNHCQDEMSRAAASATDTCFLVAFAGLSLSACVLGSHQHRNVGLPAMARRLHRLLLAGPVNCSGYLSPSPPWSSAPARLCDIICRRRLLLAGILLFQR